METIDELNQKIKTNTIKPSWVFLQARKSWALLLLALYALQALPCFGAGFYLIYLDNISANSNQVLSYVGYFLLVFALVATHRFIKYAVICFADNWFLLTDETIYLKQGWKSQFIPFSQISNIKLVIDRGFYQSVIYTDRRSEREMCLLGDRIFGAPQDLLPMITTKMNS